MIKNYSTGDIKLTGGDNRQIPHHRRDWCLEEKYNTSVAGISIRWNESSNSGDGPVLGFDLDKGFNMSHSDTWPAWAWRLKMEEILMDSASSPENFVSTIKEFHLESLNDLQVLLGAGINPLKVLGVESS